MQINKTRIFSIFINALRYISAIIIAPFQAAAATIKSRRYKTFWGGIAACFLAVTPLATYSADSIGTPNWINVGGISWHPGAQGLNGHNPGLGLEWQFDERRSFAAGVYVNSEEHRSNYAAMGWRPIRHGIISGGVVAGVVDGYEWHNRHIIPMAAPYMMIEWQHIALNVVVIPKVEKHLATTVAAQFKFRISE